MKVGRENISLGVCMVFLFSLLLHELFSAIVVCLQGIVVGFCWDRMDSGVAMLGLRVMDWSCIVGVRPGQ